MRTTIPDSRVRTVWGCRACGRETETGAGRGLPDRCGHCGGDRHYLRYLRTEIEEDAAVKVWEVEVERRVAPRVRVYTVEAADEACARDRASDAAADDDWSYSQGGDDVEYAARTPVPVAGPCGEGAPL